MVSEELAKENPSIEEHSHSFQRGDYGAEASSAGGINKELVRKIATQHCQKDLADETGQLG